MDADAGGCAVFDDGSGPKLYIGGWFGSAGGVASGGVVSWDGTAWSPVVGGATPSDVHDLLVFDDGSGPALYAAGIPYIWRWSGSAWSALPSLAPGGIYDLEYGVVGNLPPQLYAAGSFHQINGVPAAGIARWDGAAWHSLGSGLQGGVQVRADRAVIADLGSGPELFVGGKFNSAGGVAAVDLARWNGTSWSALGSGLTGAPYNVGVRGLALHDDGGGALLYVGGGFQTAGGQPAPGLARWDGAAWSSASQPAWGSTSDTFALSSHDLGSGPELFVGGHFTLTGGTTASGIARVGSTGWSQLTLAQFTQNYSVFSGPLTNFAAFDDGDSEALYAVGRFAAIDGVPCRNVIRFDGSAWSALGPPGWGVDSTVYAATLCYTGNGDELYIGGTFISAGGVDAKRVAKRVGQRWEALGEGLSGTVWALTSFDDGTGPALYAGGEFTSSGASTVRRLARWNGTSWAEVGGGVDATVKSLTVADLGNGPALYVGGAFTSVGGVPASLIAKWDGVQWTALGAGIQGSSVNALQRFDHGGTSYLYAGGQFGLAGSAACTNVARWNGTTWSAAATSMTANNGSSAVSALTVFGGQLHAGGNFTSINGAQLLRIARFDGAAWSSLGFGLGGGDFEWAYSLAIHDEGSGPALYAGGSFSDAGTASSANGIARWNGASWSDLDGGLLGAQAFWPRGVAYALCSFSDTFGPALYVGGSFATAGSVSSSNVARWSCDNEPVVYCTAKTNSAGCVPSIASFGIASATLGSGFELRALDVLNQKSGLLFYGVNGQSALPFQGGLMCVVGPLRRTAIASSAGSSSGVDCTGSHALDFNVRIASGSDPALVAGQSVWAQWYTRDPAATFHVGLTDAIAFAIRE